MGGDGFHHIVLFRLRAGITLDRVRAAKEELGALVETLPGVRELSVSHNVAEPSHGYTLALISHFDNRRAYEFFARNPDARGIVDRIMDDLVESHIVFQSGDEH